TLLMFLVVLTVIAWLLQELIGRRQQQWAVAEHLQFGKADVDPSGEPTWPDWTFKIILAAWIFWLRRFVMVKAGDFALVLVMLTLLSGVIGGLDRFWFERRRRAQSANLQSANASSVGESLVAQRPIAEYSRSFFPVLAAVLVLRSFVAEPFQIPSASM